MQSLAIAGDIGTGQKLNARPTFTGTGQSALRSFADATARDVALTSPTAGDKCYLSGTSVEQVYNGADWDSLGVSAPITASIGNVKVGQDIQNDSTDTDFFVKTSSGAGDEDKVPVLNADGDIADGFISSNIARTSEVTAVNDKLTFGGDGSDGALNVTSGTTSLDASTENVLVKNYSSINISAGATLGLSNKATAGTILMLRCSGDVNIEGTIDLTGIGANKNTN